MLNTKSNFKASVRKSVNSSGVIVDNKRYIIDEYELVIDLTRKDLESAKVVDVKHIPDGDGCFVIKQYDNGLYSYGYMCNQEKDRPGHGGMWSSSAGTIFEATGYEFIDVMAGSCVYALPIEQAKTLLPEGYFITRLGDRCQFDCGHQPHIYCVDNGVILD